MVDADLSKYFDTMPHDELMSSIAHRIVDANMSRLINQWLKAPVETTGADGGTRMEGGKASKMGVPQGRVISPLVANLYMNRFLKYWRRTGKGEAWDAHIINYADEFVILSRGYAAEAPRPRKGKPGVDRRCDDASRVDPEPDEDPAVRCTDGPVRLSGLQLRPASPLAATPMVHRGFPVG